uniref:Reverse transcriptase domain-containing protein n=1 Tax=Tanacetum cinerariifolium TaxID=118510 RepID=A0A6L2JHM2_TANCI|nr:hypothetical protein [Tanacetum cinerariifolium]
MRGDVLTVGSTMRIPLLYRGEYSQWVERFMNYLKELTYGEAMINSIKNGDQPLPRVTQVSIAGTTSTEQPPLKDKSMWSDQEKRVQKIDRLVRSLLIQGLPNDIYSPIDSNKTAKDLWDALARHMLGSEYGEHDRKAAILYESVAIPRIIQNQGDVNDAMGSKKKTVVVTSDPLALIADKTNVSRKTNMANDPNNFQGPPPVGPNFQNPNLDLCPMEELLQAPGDGVGDAIVGYNQNQAQQNVPSLEEIMLQHMRTTKAKMQQMQDYNNQQMQHLETKNTNMANMMGQMQKVLQERHQGALLGNTIPNPREEIKSVTTRSGNVLARPSVPLIPLCSSSKEVKREPETITDQVLPKITTCVPPLVVHPSLSSRSFEIPPSPISTSSELPKWNPHQHPIPYPSSLAEALTLMPKYHKMLKNLLSDKEKQLGLVNTSLTENCSAVLLKKLSEKLKDPGKFLIPCDFLELEKCMALADLGTNINLMPLSVWKILILPELVPTHMILELSNHSLTYPPGIAEDVCVQEGKFTFSADFVVFDYDVDPRVLFILGRPFLRTAFALVDVYKKELILRDEVLKVQKSDHPFSGSTTFSSNSFPSSSLIETSDSLLEEFVNELALLDSFPSGNKDNNFDLKADLKEIEYLLNRDLSTDSLPTTDFDIIDPILKSDSTHPEESSESPEIATLLSCPFGNEDKVFNPGILILGRTQIYNDESKDKDFKVNTSFEAFLILEERNFLPISSDYKLIFFLELTVIETLLSFSSKNEDKVSNPKILISKGVYSLTLELSHQTYETFKIVNVHLNILNEGTIMGHLPNITGPRFLPQLYLDFISSANFFSRGISFTQQWEPVFTSGGKIDWQWELITGSGNALSILFPTLFTFYFKCYTKHLPQYRISLIICS